MKTPSKNKTSRSKVWLIIFVIIITSIGSSLLIARKLYWKFFVKTISQATLQTNMGDITFRFRESAPRAKENFIKLVRNGLYDKTRIHRIVPKTLIEGGDPLSKFETTKLDWGKGGPGYTFPDEIAGSDRMLKGVVAMVNTGPDTNGSQFFILATDAEWLNGQHTILGDVIIGIDVVENISSAPVGVTGIPAVDLIINSVVLK